MLEVMHFPLFWFLVALIVIVAILFFAGMIIAILKAFDVTPRSEGGEIKK